MNAKKLLRIIGEVDDDLIEDAASTGKTELRLHRRAALLRWGAIAACILLVAGIGIRRVTTQRLTTPPELVEAESTDHPLPADRAATFSLPAESSAGPRRMFLYGGLRYAFMDRVPEDLSGFTLGEALGTLEYDILAGMDGSGDNPYADMDFATTFALGGTLYEVTGYAPAFRLAVVWEGETYLAEAVGRADDAPLDAGEYITAAGLTDLADSVHILDHMGLERLHSFADRKDAVRMLEILSLGTPAELTSDQYEALARAQSEGGSFQLEFALSDGTAVTLYLVPSLMHFSLGDGNYHLPQEFLDEYGDILGGLEQNIPLPLS